MKFHFHCGEISALLPCSSGKSQCEQPVVNQCAFATRTFICCCSGGSMVLGSKTVGLLSSTKI